MISESFDIESFGVRDAPSIESEADTRVKAVLKSTPCRAYCGRTAHAVEAILTHHYVNDFLESFSSEEEEISISQHVRALHMDARFEVCNFTSNSPKVLAAHGGIDVSHSIDKKQGFVGEWVLSLFWQSSSYCSTGIPQR